MADARSSIPVRALWPHSDRVANAVCGAADMQRRFWSDPLGSPGARLDQRSDSTEVTSSSIFTEAGGAYSSAALMRSHCSVFSRGRGFIRTRCQRPSNRCPRSSNSIWPFSNDFRASCRGTQSPRSHTIMVPPPYSPFWYCAFEFEIFEGMIFGPHRKGAPSHNVQRECHFPTTATVHRRD